MRLTSNKNAWIWVALAAVTLTALSRSEADLLNAKAGANPVLAFLIKGQTQTASAQTSASLHLPRIASRLNRSASEAAGAYAFVSMLPVFFVGLLTPLAMASVAIIRALGRTPALPLLCASFQRPPPPRAFAAAA